VNCAVRCCTERRGRCARSIRQSPPRTGAGLRGRSAGRGCLLACHRLAALGGAITDDDLRRRPPRDARLGADKNPAYELYRPPGPREPSGSDPARAAAGRWSRQLVRSGEAPTGVLSIDDLIVAGDAILTRWPRTLPPLSTHFNPAPAQGGRLDFWRLWSSSGQARGRRWRPCPG